MKAVLRHLERLRVVMRVMMVAQRGAVIAGGLGGALMLGGFIDYVLRLPGLVRLVGLVAAVVGVGVAVRRYLMPAIVFRPTLTQLALRLEESAPALRHRLASSVEFVLTGMDATHPLAARSVRETSVRVSGQSLGRCVRPGRLVRGVAMVLVAGGLIGCMFVISPAHGRIGAGRLLLPLGSAQWPARTAVVSVMHEVVERGGVYERGRALALRARNLTPRDAAGRVDAQYRLQRGGESGAWQRIVLTHQGNGIHERLVETNADGIEVYFATEDARTKVERIMFVARPAVVSAAVRITPPAYAAELYPEAVIDLGPGTDGRAVAERAGLVGSTAEMEVRLNKALAAPDEAEAFVAWRAGTFAWSEPAPATFEVEGAPDGTGWRVRWPLAGTSELRLNLVGEHGLVNDEVVRYRIEAVDDLAPTVSLTAPPTDEHVLASAVVSVVAEAGDDVALRRVGVGASVERSEGGESEALPFSRDEMAEGSTAVLEAALDLRELDVTAGETVVVRAFAEDGCIIAGKGRAATRSAARRLSVVTAEEFGAQIRRDLGAVRVNAIRIDELQGALRGAIESWNAEDGLSASFGREQAQISERIADQRGVVEALAWRVAANRFDDAELASLLRQSAVLVSDAGAGSNRAADALEAWRGAGGSESASGEGAMRSALEAQADVRRRLADLVALLDRDEDAWIVQRRLDEMIQEQDAVAGRAEALLPETIGQSRGELGSAQLTALDEIVRRQLDLRQRVKRLLEEMHRRAEAMEGSGSVGAALRRAADAGERREVVHAMELAAARAQRNQLQGAVGAQRAAGEAMRQMRGLLDDVKKAGVEELLRVLADLVESIDHLIEAQRQELAALERRMGAEDLAERDGAMVRLVRNTRAVASEARRASARARGVARALDEAAGAQDDAITALRVRPVAGDDALRAEQGSLALLEEAQRRAAQLRAQVQADHRAQRLREVIDGYRALAAEQRDIREGTLAYVRREALSRREVFELRRLGEREDALRGGLEAIEVHARELTESEVFGYVHELLDRWAGVVAERLRKGEASRDVVERQAMIVDALVEQIEALEERPAPPEEFSRQARAGGSGGGGGSPGAAPLILPAAELSRLYRLQEFVHVQTQLLETRSGAGDAVDRDRVRELAGMQRELIGLTGDLVQKLQRGATDSGTVAEPR